MMDDTETAAVVAAGSWERMEAACREYDAARVEVRDAVAACLVVGDAGAEFRLEVARVRLQRAERRMGR